MKPNTKCGFVAILGAPNAGKSTLMNQMVGNKVSIVSRKVQTTRMRVLGIRQVADTQLVFVDTPGIFKASKRWDRAMVQAAWEATKDADKIVVIIDCHNPHLSPAKDILKAISQTQKHPILVLNKVDLVPKDRLLPLIEDLKDVCAWEDIFMISALKGDGVQDLLNTLAEHMPESPWLFPEDQISDMPQRLLAAEITREKVFHNLHQELPYSIAVETEQFETMKNGSLKIYQTIYVQKKGQKVIILGQGGQSIKRIGQQSREELTKLFECPVHVFLHVKVKEDWMEKPNFYQMLGLNYNV